jgi:hypothetical protein
VSAIVWLLWLQFCFFSAILSVFWSMIMKTHAKASQTSQRADLLAPVAKTANTASTNATAAKTVTDVIGANASFLATLRSASDPIAAGSPSLAYTGPSNNTNAVMFSWLETGGSFNGLWVSMVSYIAALGTCVNSIISEGSTAGIWP